MVYINGKKYEINENQTFTALSFNPDDDIVENVLSVLSVNIQRFFNVSCFFRR